MKCKTMPPKTTTVLMPDNGYEVATLEYTENHQQVLGYDCEKVRALADRINRGEVQYMVPRIVERGDTCRQL